MLLLDVASGSKAIPSIFNTNANLRSCSNRSRYSSRAFLAELKNYSIGWQLLRLCSRLSQRTVRLANIKMQHRGALPYSSNTQRSELSQPQSL